MKSRYALPAAVLVEVIAHAIADFEGYFNGSDTRARRNRNPGNIRSWGRVKRAGGFAEFRAVEDGWRALRLQAWKNVVVRGLTLREFFGGRPGFYAGYAPAGDDNQPDRYAQFVRERLVRYGIPLASIDAPLMSLTSGASSGKYPGLGKKRGQ